MAPVVAALSSDNRFDSQICVTAQHRGMLDQVLELFDISPDVDLDLMLPGQSLSDLTGRALSGLCEVIERLSPDRVLVHGDTTTTMAASLAAYYCRIPVGHVEAGLRTGDIYAPWPEEINRRVAGVIADLHFAPTQRAQSALLAEGVDSDRIVVTGNTVIDALLTVVERLDADPALLTQAREGLPDLDDGRALVLVTGHRRENFGEGFLSLCRAIAHVADREDVCFVYPVHLNPNVQGPVHELLGGHPNVILLEPLGYLSFVDLMRRADIVLTDSGGVQEEAPALGKPVLVMREVSERPDSVEAGCARLVGTSYDRITDALHELLDHPDRRSAMVAGGSPYGDGSAAAQIADALHLHGLRTAECATAGGRT